MQSARAATIVIGWFALFAASVLADAEPSWKVSAELVIFVVAEKEALALLGQLRRDDGVEVAFAQLEKGVSSGSAELLAATRVMVRGTNSAIIESGEEMPYPTEFDPPDLPREMPAANAAEALKAWPAVSITPTAFEKRLVGVRLEFGTEKIAPDGVWAEVVVKVVHTRFQRMIRFESGILPGGKTIGVEQPVFHSVSSSTSTRLHHGRRVWIGAHKLPDKRWEFHFLRGQIEPL